MNVNSIGVLSIAPTTATSAQPTQPALEKPEGLDVSGVTLPLSANDNTETKSPPPPGLGQIVDKTV